MILLNGCSFTYGDELENPDKERWGTHLGELLGKTILNKSAPGASNSRIFRTTMGMLSGMEDLSQLEGVIIMWSAFERVEMISLHAEHNYDRDSNLINSQFLQMSPSRISKNNRSITRNWQAWETFYGEIYTRETGIVNTINYMSWVKWICDQLKVTCIQGWFHEGNRVTFAKTFSPARIEQLGPRLTRIYEPVIKKFNALPPQCKLGATENDGPTFHEFTMKNNFKLMPREHPGPEAHKAYGEQLFNYIKNKNIVFEQDMYTPVIGTNLPR